MPERYLANQTSLTQIRNNNFEEKMLNIDGTASRETEN